MKLLLIIVPSGPLHCTPNRESSTGAMIVHVSEKSSPAVGVPGGGIVALGGRAEG